MLIRRFIFASLTAFTIASTPVAAAPPSLVVPRASTTQPANDAYPDNDFMDLERDLSQCISSNPLPGCGREPTSAGDRGGWQQFLLFGIMMGGIALIFWRIASAIRARDRSATAAAERSEP